MKKGMFRPACLVVLFAVIALVSGCQSDPAQTNAAAVRQLFQQADRGRWKDFDFSNGLIPQASLRPLLDESQAEAARKASEEAGIEKPILPYFDAEPEGGNAKYYFAVYHRDVTDEQGYWLRFLAYAGAETLSPVYSLWISAVPTGKDRNGNDLANENQDESIYSVTAAPEEIEEDMSAYFNRK